MWSRSGRGSAQRRNRNIRCSRPAPWALLSVLSAVAVVSTGGCTWDWHTLEQGTAGGGPVEVELLAQSACVRAGGELSLSWSSVGATACEAMGPGWAGPRAANGMEELTDPEPGSYLMRCTGPEGEAESSVAVFVDAGSTSVDAVRAPFERRDLADGSSDEWHTDRHLVEELQEGAHPGSRDLVATFRVAWDAERLYVLVSVVDNDVQVVPGAAELDYDLVEVMINGLNDEPYHTPDGYLRFALDDHRLAFSPEGVLWTTDPAQPRGTELIHRTWLTDSGYELELGLRWPFVVGQDAHVPSAGDAVGFNVAVVDRDAGDESPSIVVWRLTDRRWRNTAGWGTVQLGCSVDG